MTLARALVPFERMDRNEEKLEQLQEIVQAYYPKVPARWWCRTKLGLASWSASNDEALAACCSPCIERRGLHAALPPALQRYAGRLLARRWGEHGGRGGRPAANSSEVLLDGADDPNCCPASSSRLRRVARSGRSGMPRLLAYAQRVASEGGTTPRESPR